MSQLLELLAGSLKCYAQLALGALLFSERWCKLRLSFVSLTQFLVLKHYCSPLKVLSVIQLLVLKYLPVSQENLKIVNLLSTLDETHWD